MQLRTIVLCRLMLAAFLVVAWRAGAEAAERFYISIPGPTLSYVPLYYGQEKGFFTQEGLDLQILVVRGIVGVSSLMSGEIDVTCHAGSGGPARRAGEGHLRHARPANP
jgi:ABC-type nitrate/sulfonate/bicarbonate transport system substrate-binding protein